MINIVEKIKEKFSSIIARERVYNVKNSRIKESKTFSVISDAHGDVKKFSAIMNRACQNSDAIILNGDIFDRVSDKNNEELINIISNCALRKKIYVVIGNHELVDFVNGKEVPASNIEMLDILRKIPNVYVPDSPTDEPTFKNWDLGGVLLKTINLPIKYYEGGEKKEELVNHLNKEPLDLSSSNDYVISAIHTPKNIIIDKKKIKTEAYSVLGKTVNALTQYVVLDELKKSDLIISGHMHGGLVPDFIRSRKEHFFGLAGPYATILPKFSSGLYNGKNPLIISGGLTKISSESGLGFITKNVVFKTVLDRWLFPPEYFTLKLSNGADSVELVESNRLVLK